MAYPGSFADPATRGVLVSPDVGNGTTDATAAINAAMTAACAAGGSRAIVLRPGTYIISSPITLKASIISEGSTGNPGDAAVVIKASGTFTGNTMLALAGGNPNGELRNIEFNANGQAVSVIRAANNAGAGAVLWSARNCTMYGCSEGTYVVQGINNCLVGWLFESCDFFGSQILQLNEGEDDILFLNCRFSQNATAVTARPMVLQPVNLKFYNCYFNVGQVSYDPFPALGYKFFCELGVYETTFDACFFETGHSTLRAIFAQNAPKVKCSFRTLHINLANCTGMLGFAVSMVDGTTATNELAWAFDNVTKYDGNTYPLLQVENNGGTQGVSYVSADVRNANAWTVSTVMGLRNNTGSGTLADWTTLRMLTRDRHYLTRNIHAGRGGLWLDDTYPNILFNSTVNSTKSFGFAFNDNVFTFSRYANNFGAYEASPLSIAALAPSGSLAVNADGSVSFGGSISAANIRNTGGVYDHVGYSGAIPVSAAGEGRIYFDSNTNKFRVSQNGAAFTDLVAGTVTTLSVVSANGFAGTVANASTTPAITLTTSITGLLKGDGTAISAAAAGTDFVGVGAVTTSGLTMSTARLLGRTTAATGAIEEISVGSGLSLAGGVLSATGGGTVTSVGLSLPAIFSVTGSPVTGSGTLTATLATQLANRVWAGPTSGGASTPTFRALVSADIPALVSGNQIAYGNGSGVITSSASLYVSSGNVFINNTGQISGGMLGLGNLVVNAADNLSGTITVIGNTNVPSNESNAAALWLSRRAGTAASPAAVAASDVLGALWFGGYNTSGLAYNAAAGIFATSQGSWATDQRTLLTIRTTDFLLGTTDSLILYGRFASFAGGIDTTTALALRAGQTGFSTLRIPHGSAPTTPVNGDVWTTTTGLFIRVNGATHQYAYSTSAWSAGLIAVTAANGALTTSADFTYASGVARSFTFGGTDGAGASRIIVRGVAGQYRQIGYATSGSLRWAVGTNLGPETGSDAGSDFVVDAYNDAGARIDSPIQIVRALGGLLYLNRPVQVVDNTPSTSRVSGSLTVSGGLGVVGAVYAQDFRATSTIGAIGTPAAAVSASGQGTIYFDSTSNTFKVSQNGSAYVDMLGGGGTPTNQLPSVFSDTSQTLAATVGYAEYSGSGGNTFTLPAANAVTANSMFVIIKNNGTGDLLVLAAGSDTLDDGTITSIPLTPGQSRTLVSNKSNRWSIN